MKKILFAALMAMVVTSAIAAPTFRELLTEEKAKFLATHELVLKYSDLTGTGTNATPQAFTNAVIAAGTGVELVGSYLVKPFKTIEGGALTNVSLVLTAGTPNSAGIFLTTQQMCAQGTEDLFRAGSSNQFVYTAATQLCTVVTPPALYTVSSNSQGEVHLLYRLRRYTDATAR